MIRHLLNDALTVYRASFAADGRGGRVKTMSEVGTVRARVSQPSAEERRTAGREGATLDAVIHVAFRADVQRGDELDDGGSRRWRVVSVVNDSSRTYRRLECQAVQGA